jgi:hypothetical protein
MYPELRSMILGLTPHDIGIKQTDQHPNVWGVLMEFQLPEEVVTLVSLADSTTSLYFSHGGGVIGAGAYDAVAQASQNWIAMAESFFPLTQRTEQFPFPASDRVRFYLLTFAGTYTVDRDKTALERQQDVFWPLFYAGHEVITQIRRHASAAEGS